MTKTSLIGVTLMLLGAVDTTLAEKISIDVSEQCVFLKGQTMSFQSILKLEGQEQVKKWMNVTCSKITQRCAGFEVSLESGPVNIQKVNSFDFKADMVTVGPKGGTYALGQTMLIAGENEVSLIISENVGGVKSERRWNGKCSNTLSGK